MKRIYTKRYQLKKTTDFKCEIIPESNSGDIRITPPAGLPEGTKLFLTKKCLDGKFIIYNANRGEKVKVDELPEDVENIEKLFENKKTIN